MGAGQPQQGLEGSHWGAAAIEAEGELIEVGLEVPVTDPVMSPTEPSLEVAKDPMNARQDLVGSFRVTLDSRPMTVTHLRQGVVGPPAVGEHSGPARDIGLYESRQCGARRVRDNVEAHPPGRFSTDFHRGHN